jgi:ATP-dependent Zn protease
MVDAEVKKILDESHERVMKLLKSKDRELRELAKNLF